MNSFGRDENEESNEAVVSTAEPTRRGMPEKNGKKKETKARPTPKTEHSVELRATATAIALLCIVVAATYTKMSFVFGILYFWLAATGSYVSFYLRGRRVPWLVWLIGLGLLGVMAQFCLEIYAEFRIGRIEGLIPFIHVLIGLLTLQTFDLETKTDINVSVLIALGLFTCTAVIGTDLVFGFFVLVLVLLGTLMLYFESVARTKANEPEKKPTTSPVPLTVAPRPTSGMSVLPILSIPALSFLFFLMLPRVDSIVDVFVNYVHSFNKGDQPKLSFLPGPDIAPDLRQDKNKDKAKDNKDKNKDDKGKGQKPNDFQFGTMSKDGKPGGTGGAPGAGGKDNKDSKDKGGASASADGKKDATGTANSGGKDEKGKGSTILAGKDKQGGKGNDGKSGGTAKNGQPLPGDKKSAEEREAERKEEQQAEAQESDQLVFRNAEAAQNDNELVMYVASPETVYLRRMYFDEYDGHHWTVSKHTAVADCEKMAGNYAELGGVPSLHVPKTMKTKEVVQQITVMASIGHVLPTADVPQSVAIGDEKITVDDYGVVRCKNPLREVTNYEVISKVPVFDLNALAQVKTPEPSAEFKIKFANYLQLPEKLPTEIEAEAQRVGEGDGNWFVRAERISQYLKRSCKYSTVPYTENPDSDVVADFLFKKKAGACGEFSSAFVILCRCNGIPARVVGGYSPGDYDSQKDRREIRAKDGHSWGEIYLPDTGWIPFDATPSGTLPNPPENVNPMVAAVDRSLKEFAANFSAQQMDRQFSHGRDQNYAVSMKDAKVHGLKNTPTNNSNPQLDLSKGQNKDDRQNPPPQVQPQVQVPRPDERPKGYDFRDSTQKTGHQVEPWVFVLIGAGVLLVVGAGFAAYVFRAHLRRFIFRSEFPRVSKGVKPSTLVYLKLSDDLRRLKVLRRPSDTAEDLNRRFFDNFSEDQPCHPELPSLFQQFMELYWQDRFGSEEDSVENYKQLREIGTRIHMLAKAKPVDKAS
ncbi:MAG TPA: transglutaminase domain-containing protein [Oculatellaceae cyanobacterium]